MPISAILKEWFLIHALIHFIDLKYEMVNECYKLQSKFTARYFKNKTKDLSITLNF